MKYFLIRAGLLVFLFFSLNGIRLYGQQPTSQQVYSLGAGHGNYQTFTAFSKSITDEVVAGNKGYESHPELGMLFPGAPCKDCYELIGDRTENTKTFVKNGTGGRDIMHQTASGPLHYKGPNGEWLTIKSILRPDGQHNGVFAATAQKTQVEINTANKFSSLGSDNSLLQFNRNLELLYAKPDGTQQQLGAADYSHYTAGDDGVYITDAWPGIDIEMLVVRGAIKTNFLIKHAMPAYAAGSLIVRDHLFLSDGMVLYVPDENKHDHIGNLEIKKAGGQTIYAISAANAFEKAAGRGSLRLIPYHINGNDIDIVLPGNFLNRAASAYPVIIDPLVSASTSTGITGSQYSSAWTTGCSYINPATVPAKVTVTDVQFTFQYVASGGALTNNGAYDFKLGACRSPAPTSLFWNCSSGLPGTCDAVGASIFLGQIAPCIPAPQCTAYDLNLTMEFYQNYASTSGCSPTYIAAGTPLTITVFGHTIESNAVVATASNICPGQTTILIASSLYGVPPYTYVWTPGGTVGSSDTVSPMVTTTYTVTSTDACGNTTSATKTINVNTVGPIGGQTTICAGGSSTLTCSPSGGTWSSSNPSVASVGSSSGTVSGIGLGSATITYTMSSGCYATTTVNVTVPVAPISGYLVVCQGSTTSLSDATPGGTWSSGNTSVGTVGSTTGVAMGVSGGIAVVTYATSGAGCYSTATLSVNATAPITGTTTICVGGNTTLANSVPGGSWTSGNTTIATIGASSGVVYGVSAGTVTMTYTTPSGCIVTTSVAVNLLSPITGTTHVCQGNTTTLNDAASGGSWSSANPSIASIGSSSGLVSGAAAGATTITYTIPGGCFATAGFTVNPIGAISGTTTVCVGGTTSLSNPAGAGTWSSSNPSVASIGASSGIVTGVSVGTANVTYTSAAGCTAYVAVNVGLPTPITGTTVICQGGSSTLSNSTTGGSWSSANPAIASINASSGLLSGVSGGNTVISYTTPSGCVVTTTVTINANPPITGAAAICVGSTITLSSAAAGGTWTSATPSVAVVGSLSGIVSALSTGSASITYTTPAGCTTSVVVTVNVPSPITGTPAVCQGSTTLLSNAAPGGTWSSSNSSIASVGSSTGLVSGVSGGTVIISYNTAGGCNATASVTVNPISPVTGTTSLCQGNTSLLADATPGGTWSSINPSVATIDATSGLLTGVGGGSTIIDYTTPAGCVASAVVIVNYAPAPITGSTLVCTTTTLSDAVGGGLWSSSNPSIASVGPTTGLVTGIGPGTVTITYTLSGGCYTTVLLTVNPLASISGVPSVCQGTTTALSYPQPGGTWSSLNPAVATVDPSSGVVTGVSSGSTTVKYTTTTGCVASVIITVYPLLPVTGIPTVCQGNTTLLSDAVPGGTFSSADLSIASVGTSSGIVTGIASGVVVINYTTAAGCVASSSVTVNPLAPVTGSPAVCAGSSTALNDAVPGGTWSSTLPAIATIDPSTGVVNGISGGVTVIKYTTSLGCVASFNETVNPLPSAIGGIPKVCAGSTTVLTNTLSGGVWSVSSPAVATIGAGTGIAYGVSADTVTVKYTSSAGCFVTIIITVNPLPAAITGITSICQGQTSTLADATAGGTWSSTATAIAPVGSLSGIVSGLSAGSAIIKYTTPEGCTSIAPFVVNPLPGAITGTPVVCEGAGTTLHNSLPGGLWYSANPAIATMAASSGVMTGIGAGITNVTYITPSGCSAFIVVTVNPTPVINSVTSTGPTTCVTNDGTITLLGLHPGETYTLTYSAGSTVITSAVTASGAGQVIISGLAAGTYSNFSVTTSLGCTSNIVAGPVVLVLPAAPPAPVAASNTPLCEGDPLNLTATDAVSGVTYSWTGPVGFTSVLQNPVISPTVLNQAGTYTVTATKLGCVSASATTVVVIHPVPVIAGFTYTNPSTCEGTEGTVRLHGLTPGISYTVTYTFNSAPASVVVIADASGDVIITGLTAGIYSGFSASSYSCVSNEVGPVTLKDPNPPPAPTLYSNSPICAGKTLTLDATDDLSGLTYEWVGPNGFTSADRNPEIPSVTQADSGVYTLTIRYRNCPTVASETVVIYPPVVITYITPDQIIPLGATIGLKAEGGRFYTWMPNDGSLSAPNMDSTMATPAQTTVYSVRVMNVWGCMDTAAVTITVDQNVNDNVPSAFTPNDDGKNDVFRIENIKYDRLVDFSVFNRWGQLIYHNTTDPAQGWDGKFNGVPQDMGVYNYNIVLSAPSGKLKHFTGTVTLIR